MGLKAFHLLFISLSIVAAVFAGLWSLSMLRADGSPLYLVVGVLSFAAAAGLGAYGSAFLKRARKLRLCIAALVVFVPSEVLACPICFGAAEGPMIESMNNAIVLLLGITVAVLGGFATFFIRLARRIARSERSLRVGPQAH